MCIFHNHILLYHQKTHGNHAWMVSTVCRHDNKMETQPLVCPFQPLKPKKLLMTPEKEKKSLSHLLLLIKVNDWCLTPNKQFVSYVMVKTNYLRWYNDVHFVLDQHADLDSYLTNSLKQSVDRYITPLWHIIPASESQPFFALTP